MTHRRIKTLKQASASASLPSKWVRHQPQRRHPLQHLNMMSRCPTEPASPKSRVSYKTACFQPSSYQPLQGPGMHEIRFSQGALLSGSGPLQLQLGRTPTRTAATPLVQELPWHAATHEWNMVERNADRRSNPLFARHCFFRFWANIQFKVHEVSRNLLHRQIGLVPEVSDHGLSRQDATRDHLRKDSQQGLGECIFWERMGHVFRGWVEEKPLTYLGHMPLRGSGTKVNSLLRMMPSLWTSHFFGHTGTQRKLGQNSKRKDFVCPESKIPRPARIDGHVKSLLMIGFFASLGERKDEGFGLYLCNYQSHAAGIMGLGNGPCGPTAANTSGASYPPVTLASSAI